MAVARTDIAEPGGVAAVQHREIFCCGCSSKVRARLTDGREIYPRRPDLADLPFWRCDECGNHVGCHHKTKNRTFPLGVIATPELKGARQHLHALIDPLWQSGRFTRKAIYAAISERVGWPYHTAKIRTVEEARQVYRVVQEIQSGAKT